MNEPQLLNILKVQSNLGPADFEAIFKDQDRARRLFMIFAKENWNLISFMFNKINGEDRVSLLSYVSDKIKELPSDKTKCIEITTKDVAGYSEMSGLVNEIDKMLKDYDAEYEINYYFK